MSGYQFASLLLVMAGCTYLVRALPLLIFRKKIQSAFLRSLLFYAPYAILAAMTFPDILFATGSFVSAGVGCAFALLAAWQRRSLMTVALFGSGAAVIAQLLMDWLV